MGKRAVIYDLIQKGIDPRTAVVGQDGLFTAPEAPNLEVSTLSEAAIDVQEKPSHPPTRNALVFLPEQEGQEPKASSKPKAKKKQRVTVDVLQVVQSTEEYTETPE